MLWASMANDGKGSGVGWLAVANMAAADRFFRAILGALECCSCFSAGGKAGSSTAVINACSLLAELLT